ncbi:MAG TPA: endonuclease III [Polyangia bacterium]|nr:endonuclease III [Polyangia bacterium]
MAHRKRPIPLKRLSESKRVAAILAALDEHHPDAHCELDHKNAFQLVVATILSAQCTDKRVNLVTPALFARFPDARALAQAEPAQLEDMIRSTGFFRNKTKSLIAMARRLVEAHGGAVPRTMDELTQLPGVARKTANVVLGTAFGVAAGVVVDTHVARLAPRLGLSRHDEPEKIEQDLMKKIPRERWIRFAHQLIWHGRRVCFARTPNCGGCRLAPYCPSAFAAG